MMKKILLLFFVIILFLPKPASAAQSVPILMYHYIGNNPNPKDTARNALSVSPDKFDAQLNWLKNNGYTPITLNTLYGIYDGKAFVNKPVVLTFDDGYMDFYFNAYPILQKYNFHAVSFIPTGLMNQGYYLSWNQIREISNSGLVEFDSHGVTHKSLSGLAFGALNTELADSRAILRAQTGQAVNFIAYPNGAYNSLVLTQSSWAGYAGGVATWAGKAWGKSMVMPRIRMTGGPIPLLLK